MSKLEVFGRNWHVGALEGLLIPASCGLLFRIPFVVILSVTLYLIHTIECSANDFLPLVWCVASLILQTTTSFLHIMIIRNSLYVTIRQVNKCLVSLVYIKFGLFVFEIAVLLTGTIWVFVEGNTCIESDFAMYSLTATVLIMNWIVVVSSLCFTYCLMMNEVILPADWNLRCQRMMCWRCWKSREHEDEETTKITFEEIGQNFATMLHDIDGLVPSDLGIGLILLRHLQRHEIKNGKRFRVSLQHKKNKELKSYKHSAFQADFQRRSNTEEKETGGSGVSRPTVVSPMDGQYDNSVILLEMGDSDSNSDEWMDDAQLCEQGIQPNLMPEDWQRLSAAKYFLRFAIGIYGLPLHLLDNPCGLCSNFCLFRPQGLEVGRVFGKNMCCWSSMKVFLRVSGIPAGDILHASYLSGVHRATYFVVLDRNTNSIVFMIRGTLSVPDCVTDGDAVPMEIDPERIPGFGSDHYAHKGMLLASYRVHDEISNNEQIQSFIKSHPDWNTVLTGHSLGAGASALLAIMMRHEIDPETNELRYNNVRCYTIAPPLLVDEKLAYHPDVLEMTTCIVNHDDIVPRMSLLTLNHLKHQMKALMELCHKTNWEVLKSTRRRSSIGIQDVFNLPPTTLGSVEQPLAQNIVSVKSSDLSADTTETRRTSSISSTASDISLISKRISSAKIEEKSKLPEDNIHHSWKELHLPGLVYHIVRTDHSRIKEKCCRTSIEHYKTYCVYLSDPYSFHEIVSSTRMFTDHMPNLYEKIIDQIQFPPEFEDVMR